MGHIEPLCYTYRNMNIYRLPIFLHIELIISRLLNLKLENKQFIDIEPYIKKQIIVKMTPALEKSKKCM